MAISPLAVAQMSLRRKNFTGRTDKYLSPRAPASGVIEAVQKELGFLDFVSDNGAFNEFYRETAIERLGRYKKSMRFYEGRHFDNEYDDGERKVVFNFCKALTDKAVDFFVSKGFNLTSAKGNDDVAAALDAVWEGNNKVSLLRKLALPASITGDAYLYITIQTKDEEGNVLPEDQWTLRMIPLDPFFVFPVFSKGIQGEMTACLIQFPESKNGSGEVSYHTLYITKDEFIEKKDNETVSKGRNPFGMVNVVHFPNFDDPTSSFGQSDTISVIPLNEEYNSTANCVRKIIKYHAEPTTIIFGARASKLEKGAKKVWSGLPVDARVENLQFTADLNATYSYLSNVEEQIYKVGSIPGVLFKTDRAMSHTSGTAMKMLYEPLLNLTDRKVTSFTASCRVVNKLLLLGLDYMGVSDAPNDPKEIEALSLDIVPSFPDPLPYDESMQLDIDSKKLAAGVVSLAALIRKYNPKADLSRLSSELVADAFSRLAVKKEEAGALLGVFPDIKALLASSINTLLSDESISEAMSISLPAVPQPNDTANNNGQTT